MSWWSTSHLLLDAAAQQTASKSVARAKELLDLIASPTAVATGVLLVFTKGQLIRNGGDGGVNRTMTWWALAAGAGATIIAGTIVGVMTPLAWKMLFVNRGPVETQLLVFGLTFLVAIGTTVYAAHIAIKCIQDL